MEDSVQLMSNFYHENLLGEMQRLRLTGDLCDITVQVDFEGQLEEFEAHQVMLAASSSYFRGILLTKNPPSKIFLGTVPTSNFGMFLEFVYTAKLEVEKSKTGEILEMAKMLECSDLVEACRRASEHESADLGDQSSSQICDLQSSQSADTQEQDILGNSLEDPNEESPVAEKLRPQKRGKKRKRAKSTLGRRQSIRLAGSKGAGNSPKKKKYATRLKGPLKAPTPPREPDPMRGASDGDVSQGRATDVSENPKGAAPKMAGEPSEQGDDLADDYQDPTESYHSESDFQIEEEDEEEEETRIGEKRKRNGQFNCDKCQRSFHYEKSYLKHISASHGEVADVIYRCTTCAQTFANRCNLKIHERHVHNDERLFPCSICGKAFKRNKDVKRHCRQVHEGVGDRHLCPVCGKSLSSKTALVLHQRTHTGDRPYHCTDCGAKFSQSSALKTHRRTHTGEKPFACDQCDARFTQNHMLSYHKRCHTGEKPFMCESCGKSFASKEYLKHHARIHSGSKPYKCEICERAFAQRNSLHQHMKIHTGERPYCCGECGKQFTQLNALQRHNRIHTGEKPYMCMLCNRTFTDKSTVRRHTMTHDKDTPWKNYLVVLEGNMEGRRKTGKRGAGGAKDNKQESSSGPPNAEANGGVKQEGISKEKGGKHSEESIGTAQVQPVTLSGDWASTGHGAITLIDVPASTPLSLPLATALPAPVADAVAVSECGPLSSNMSISASPELDTMQDITSDPSPLDGSHFDDGLTDPGACKGLGPWCL
ncbi:hypothetical protein GJAV_G00115320 [Gymnothorax javanicus]|nr:hypothetical protein GJAV_G00115320 [Gymnothorax javanicus]